MALFRLRISVNNSVKVFVWIMAIFALEFWLSFVYHPTFFQNHYILTTLIYHHYLHQPTRVHNSVKFCLRNMALFRFIILVKLFIPNQIFSKQLEIYLKHLQKYFWYHYLHQQPRVHNLVKVFVRIMTLFLLIKYFAYK